MNIQKAYDSWAKIYDGNKNRTRDLDKIVTITTLSKYKFDNVLELGCGTGKNTEWILTKASNITAVDFSSKMLSHAKNKINNPKVKFETADINHNWNFKDDSFDLVTSNLVLEHIENLDFIFKNASQKLKTDGFFFICELHPFKQYSGTKARFETENGTQELEVFIHHITEFTTTAKQNDFELIELDEWFDDNSKQEIPRLVSFVFRKK